MYKSNRMGNDREEGNALPAWLKDEKVVEQSTESKPLIPRLPTKGSYGGQSAGGASNSSSQGVDVEVDYGEPSFGIMGGTAVQEIDTSWAVDYGTRDRTEFTKSKEDDNSSNEESSDDEGSSDDESSNDEESCVSEQKNKISWHDEEENVRHKTHAKKRSSTNKWHDDETRRIKTGKKVKKEAKNEDNELEVLRRPRRNCCHSFFILIQIAAILANITMVAFQVVPMVVGNLETLDKVLRCYFTFFSTFFLLSELELFKGLDNWISRGFLYTFLGVVAKEQHIAMVAKGSIPKEYWDGVWTNLFIEVASWWIIGIGCAYFFLGLICMQRVLSSCREQYQKRLQDYKEEIKQRSQS